MAVSVAFRPKPLEPTMAETREREEVLCFLLQNGITQRKDIASALEKSPSLIGKLLKHLIREKSVRKISYGVYDADRLRVMR